LGRGGAAAAAPSLLRELWQCVWSPHPSAEGRGSCGGGRQSSLEAERVRAKVVGGGGKGESERKSTVMQLM